MKSQLPEPDFYSLPDLAHVWSVSVDRIATYATAGTTGGERLEVMPCGPNRVPGVTPQEKARFEALTSPAARFPEDRFNPSLKRSYQFVVTRLSCMYYGTGQVPANPDDIAKDIEKFPGDEKRDEPHQKTISRVVREALEFCGMPVTKERDESFKDAA